MHNIRNNNVYFMYLRYILITCKSREYPFLTLDNQPIFFNNPYVIDTKNFNYPYITVRGDILPGHHSMGSLTGNVKFGVIVNANGDASNNVAYGYPGFKPSFGIVNS
jgi:hypothetical protein